MPRNPKDPNFRAVLAFGVIALLAFLVANGLLNRQHAREMRETQTWVDHTHQVVETLLTIVSMTTAAEGGQRGYIITGDPLYLEPYHEAIEGIGAEFERAFALTRDNLTQQERLQSIRRRVQDRMAILQEGVEARSQLGESAARDLVASNRGKSQMDALRAEVASAIRSERELLEERAERAREVYRRSQLLNATTTALGLLLTLLAAFFILRQLRLRERGAAELAAQSERWQVTLRSIGDAVITTDARGCVEFMNEEAERLTGWRNPDARGLPLEHVFRIINETSRAPVESPSARALREGVVVGLANHTLLIDRTGVERPIDDSAAPIRDAANQIVGVVLVFRDVTEAHSADRELRQLASDLSEADRRKNEFLAMLAHELRNPLAPIRNSVQILRGADLSPEVLSTSVAAIHRQSNQLVRLVDDLLDVSRISRGRIELRKSRVDLRDIAHESIDAAQLLCDETGQTLTISVPERPLFVDGDATRLIQSIGNLINNACKYSERGGTVRMSLYEENHFGVLSVRDTGIGIDAAQLGRIFDMFAQIDTSLDRSRGGLGIGLTLVKQFVELHGGTVEAASEGRGRGSEFRIRLPLVPASAGVATLSANDVEAAPESAKSLSAEPAAPAPPPAVAKSAKLRVLVVDDNRDSVDTLAILIRLLGYESRTASDGEEALEAVGPFSPHVVLLDIGLPKIDGYEVARRMRASDTGKELVLVALTGWGQEEDRARSREAGFDEHLVKPIDHETLTAILARVAGRAR